MKQTFIDFYLKVMKEEILGQITLYDFSDEEIKEFILSNFSLETIKEWYDGHEDYSKDSGDSGK